MVSDLAKFASGPDVAKPKDDEVQSVASGFGA
jgi:hypothetical protein